MKKNERIHNPSLSTHVMMSWVSAVYWFLFADFCYAGWTESWCLFLHWGRPGLFPVFVLPDNVAVNTEERVVCVCVCVCPCCYISFLLCKYQQPDSVGRRSGVSLTYKRLSGLSSKWHMYHCKLTPTMFHLPCILAKILCYILFFFLDILMMYIPQQF